MFRRFPIAVMSVAVLALSALWPVCGVFAHDMSDSGHAVSQRDVTSGGMTPGFVASTARPFAALMDDAMAVMDDAMRRAPMNGNAEHDFISMMIPHHQGAIDMAKSILLYSQDPALRNIALGIIAEQQNEINVMRAWLRQNQAVTPAGNSTPRR